MKKYEILEKLGQGGMGVVWKAVQKNLNREVAIKVLPKAYSENPEVKQRFITEMQICGGLLHPNIIHIFDSGEQDGTLYYVMEYVKGTTVLELVQKKGPMPVEQALKVTADMLEAMKYYHPMGLVHRDIKPANIMVKPDAVEAILMDFGLVKALYASGITLQGRLVGTPRYMSPEMLRGQLVDCRSDIFQLGLVLYEMLAGLPAFRGKDRAEVTRKLLEEEPDKLSQLNPLVTVPVEHLVANAIDKNADSRYPSAAAFLEDLVTVRDGGKVFRRSSARTMKALTASKVLEVSEPAPESAVETSPASAPTPQPLATMPSAPMPELAPLLAALAWKLGAGVLLLALVAVYLLALAGTSLIRPETWKWRPTSTRPASRGRATPSTPRGWSTASPNTSSGSPRPPRSPLRPLVTRSCSRP
ncbi:MAG: serine/threonine protein kinase [Candidatus Riflebacteria bacterium]|nr:serine/threonine protein kinase [Candidatus Riflebacteria bacterium]